MAGPLTALTVTASAQIAWDAQVTNALFGTQRSNASIALSNVFSTPTGSNLSGNQCMVFVISLVGGASSTTDLSAARANVLADATATIGHVKCAIIWLPTAAQHVTYGTTATSVTIGNPAATPSPLFGLGATDTITLKNGRMLMDFGPDVGYVIDSSNKSLKILNNDGVVTAKVIIVLVGNDT